MKILVPNKMSEVTLDQYQRFNKVQTTSKDETEIAIAAIEIFCNIENAKIIPFNDVERISKHIIKMLEEKPPFTLRWGKYGFIPDLQAITMGELIDLDTYVKDVATFHKAMAVLYRPVVKSFAHLHTIEKYTGTAAHSEAMKAMPLDIATGALVFFCNLGMDLAQNTLPYLEMPKIQKVPALRLIASLTRSGDGIKAFSL